MKIGLIVNLGDPLPEDTQVDILIWWVSPAYQNRMEILKKASMLQAKYQPIDTVVYVTEEHKDWLSDFGILDGTISSRPCRTYKMPNGTKFILDGTEDEEMDCTMSIGRRAHASSPIDLVDSYGVPKHWGNNQHQLKTKYQIWTSNSNCAVTGTNGIVYMAIATNQILDLTEYPSRSIYGS